MSLAGKAAVVIWNDVDTEARSDFVAWHNREHIPERLGIPGFRRARRGCAVAVGPEFLTLYEVTNSGFLSGNNYLARLNSPSAWTQRILPKFRNTARSLCRVKISVGCGIGGFVCTVRFADELRRDQKDLRLFEIFTIDLLGGSAELLGAHLLVQDIHSSRQEIAEQKLRTEAPATPGTVLILEGTAEDAVAAAAAELSGELRRRELSLGGDAMSGIYRLELCLTAEDCDAGH